MKETSLIKKDFNHALERLKEAVAKAVTELEIDGVIQRFEFTFELTWKMIKVFLEKEGIISNSPRSCLKEAFKIGWIESEEVWLFILEDRNLTSHLYDEIQSRDIFIRIKNQYIKEFIHLKNQIDKL